MTASSSIALVFGGSRGIGAACVDVLAASGWQVAFTYVSRAPEDAPHRHYPADIRDAAAVARVFDRVESDLGAAPTAIVANAGINVPAAPMAQFDPDNFRQLVEVNVVGAFNILAEAARRVRDGGAIVAVTTSLVRHAVPGTGPYTASKAAVESMVRAMAKELAGRRVRVNGVAPGPVDTDLFNAGKTEEAKQRMAAFSPFNRIGRPEEVAQVVRFLLSEESSWVHGQIVQPNGGMA
ncbi:SDR family oxidoreductase [Methylobacterium nodulans]|uniref:Short-chain dehydrogenase/reductase SDR n=1 Tax=Methylobacterium nodulans (strain LMG 21967 / CNCM I-2342 / ORS 2060) TaxID=460265 RepID=B8IW57_METNO|nr:SDR family oxidoreductase [Methylobacterium nodulans]ACL62647.1 short-chain dehydrogenase/reductase SDR [Methylobacterium nodulans ORS 2060]